MNDVGEFYVNYQKPSGFNQLGPYHSRRTAMLHMESLKSQSDVCSVWLGKQRHRYRKLIPIRCRAFSGGFQQERNSSGVPSCWTQTMPPLARATRTCAPRGTEKPAPGSCWEGDEGLLL